MDATFTGEIVYWRGPSPYHFVAVPDHVAAEIAELAAEVSYGWGCVPATARTGGTSWATSLFPKSGGYLVPIKAQVRADEQVEPGDLVTLELHIQDGPTALPR